MLDMSEDVVGPLQKAMVAWRTALDLQVDDALALAGQGIGKATWSKIENGHAGSYRPTTYAAIDRAFGWEIGTAEHVQAGLRTAPDAPPAARSERTVTAMRLDRIEERLGTIELSLEVALERLERALLRLGRPEG